MKSLKQRRDLLLLSLIIKGVLFYFIAFAFVYTIAIADSLNMDTVFFVIVLSLAAIKIIYSKNDLKRILLLSKKERREFDRETV